MLCYNIIALFDCIASFRLFEAHIRKSFTEWYKCARCEAASNWVPKNDLLFTLPLILSLSHYLLYVTSNGYFFIASGWFSLSCHHPFILTKIFTSPSSLWLIWTELNWIKTFYGIFFSVLWSQKPNFKFMTQTEFTLRMDFFYLWHQHTCTLK